MRKAITMLVAFMLSLGTAVALAEPGHPPPALKRKFMKKLGLNAKQIKKIEKETLIRNGLDKMLDPFRHTPSENQYLPNVDQKIRNSLKKNFYKLDDLDNPINNPLLEIIYKIIGINNFKITYAEICAKYKIPTNKELLNKIRI